MNEAQIIKTLDLAQCELRAMYKKLGYQDSNVLREIDAVHEALTKQKKLNKPDVSNSLLAEIRRAAADYVRSEGCSCCQDRDAHKEASERLGKLLRVKKYSDGSGRDFYSYASKQ